MNKTLRTVTGIAYQHPVPPFEIEKRIDGLKNAIAKLGDASSSLKTRLEPILGPDNNSIGCGTGENVPYDGCQIGQQLLTLECEVEEIANRLYSTIDRLAV